jgi:HEAT repeat protein
MLLIALALTAQTRTSSGSLAADFAALGAGPYWAAWEEPVIPHQHGETCATEAPVRLEGRIALLILVRIENGQVDQLRTSSPDCRLDSGNLPLHRIAGVTPAESIAWLKTQLAGNNAERAINAISLHAGPAADQVLEDLTAPAQPERLRSGAAFRLGSTRGASGVTALKRMVANDPSPNIRDQAVFALSLSHEPEALAALMDEAKNDRTPRVRGRALFWLARKAGTPQAEQILLNAIRDDPDRSVIDQAVLALKELPGDRGIPLLIDLAKNNPDPAIRKKAMSWLERSSDPRALDFFAKLLN